MASTYLKLPVVSGSGGGVTSFNARTGVVVSVSGDYSGAQVTNTPAGSIAATDVQAAINELDSEKQATITGAATTITSSNLTVSRALESSGAGKVAVSAVTSAELAFVSGVTSAIQTQLGTKVSALSVIGATPNANGASISGVTLNLQPASASFGGVVTTGTQTFAGAKTVTSTFTTASLTPVTNQTYDLGTSTTARYKELWAQYINAGTIVNSGTITRTGYGHVLGIADGSSSTISAGSAGLFGIALGYVFGGAGQVGLLEASENGALAAGFVGSTMGGSSGQDLRLKATGSGAFAQGYVSSNEGGPGVLTGEILSSGNGSFAQGEVDGFFFASLTPIVARLKAAGAGAFAQGNISAYNGDGFISATAPGSFAQGSVSIGTIQATGVGSFAQGRVAGASARLEATGAGSFAHGSVGSAFVITASGVGSFAIGSATASIIASATNSAQFFPGTNAQASSLAVGTLGTGIRISAVAAAMTTPTNGDIRNDSSGIVNIFSNSIDRNIQKLAQNANASVTQVGNVGTGVDDLISTTLTAPDRLSVNADRVEIKVAGNFAANANLKQTRILFDGTEIVTTGATIINGGSWIGEATVVRTGAATQLAWGKITVKDGAGVVTVYQGSASPTATLSGDVIIKCTGEATSNDDITQIAHFNDIIRAS